MGEDGAGGGGSGCGEENGRCQAEIQSISQRTLDLAQRYVDDVVLVEDAAMMDAQKWLWLHYNQMVEPAGAAVIAALPQANLGAYKHPVALICGGNAAAEPAFAASGPDLPKLRALIHVRKPGDPPHRLASAGEAVDLVNKVIAAIKAARRTYREARCTHLFMSVPAGVALMIGQLANTLGPIQTYEHVPVDVFAGLNAIVYVPVGTLGNKYRPSA